ncbi:MAG: hypothetical protein ACPGTQ_05655 [Colwellia sp.]
MYKNQYKKNKVISSLTIMAAILLTSFSTITISAEQTNALTVQSLADKLKHCESMKADQQRLSCFDQVTASLEANFATQVSKLTNEETVAIKDEKPAPVASASSLASVQSTEQTQQQKIDDFAKNQVELSKEEQKVAAEKELNEFTATVIKLKKLIRGEWVIHLDNGQKWQQIGSDRLKLKVGHLVTIRKGALGAIYLSTESSSRQIRVKRKK